LTEIVITRRLWSAGHLLRLPEGDALV